MDRYLSLLQRVLNEGTTREDRTGVGTLSIFGPRIEFDLGDGFPLVTTKKVFFRGVVEELLWFLRGETNVRSLQAAGVRIWDEWADENGDLGPVYGKQWRHWGYVDQIANAIHQIRTNPTSRRIVVSAWNVSDLPQMRLEPCHMFFQFYVTNNNKLDCHMYQRSADLFLGVPFNIASYALLTRMIAQVTGKRPGRLIISFGDAHIYLNHIDEVRMQLARLPRELPDVLLNRDIREIDDFTANDIALVGYSPYPPIKAPIAV